MAISETRRKQADRSNATKAALADAAIAVLIERGWAATTVIEVCDSAGLTRGAFHHHYDSLSALLADALRRLYAEMIQADHPEVADISGLVEITWAVLGNPRFKAVIEAWLATANDPSLGAEIGPVVTEFAGLVNPDGFSIVLTNTECRDFFLTARESMLGLAFGRATRGGQPLGHERRVLARIRTEAAAIDAAQGNRRSP